MADIESNIRVNIDTANALANIKALQREISAFQTSMAKGSATQANVARQLENNLVNTINATGKFSARITKVASTTEAFTTALEKNKLSLGQYFRYAASSSKTFGQKFQAEFNTIDKVARERVKTLQTQYVKLGRDASGAMRAMAVRPLVLDMDDLGTKTAIAAQKQQIFNQLMKQGSTNLLNFGKNTQWAGRQLMVGFTIPLSIFGVQAAQSFMKLEEQVIKFRKVYGDLFTSDEDRDAALANIEQIAAGFTKYGVAVADTVSLAAEAAAAGFGGAELQAQTQQAVKLSVLGQLDQQKALETTISLQNAFKLSSEELAESIDFLNAVENQTVVALDDITTAIPKVAPVIQALGGDVKDLSFFLAAMKEGGVNASEGANALKSSLGRLINPTQQARDMMGSLGIDIVRIVESNAGNLKETMLELGASLDTLDPLNRARAIEELFGKFQFARMSTLFDNINRDGNQAARVLDLAAYSAGELASISEKELGMTAASAMNQFRSSVEQLQAALAPIGELFLKIVTPMIDFVTDLLKNFNNLDNGVKTFVASLVGLLGVIGPVALMTFGLIANGVANLIKLFLAIRNGFKQTGDASTMLGEQTSYMTQEQLVAASVAASLDQAHQKLIQRFTSETEAINKLTQAYSRAISKQRQFTGPGMQTNLGKGAVKKFAQGGLIKGPGSGTSDSIPAMVSNGEFIVSAERTQQYLPLLQEIAKGTVPGYFSPDGGSLVGTGSGTYTNAVVLHSYDANAQLRAGNASPSMLAQELRAGEGKLLAPIIHEIARSLGATSQSEIAALIKNNPELLTLAREVSAELADELDNLTEVIGDPKYADMFGARLRQKVSALSADIQAAVEEVLTRITTIEDTTKLRIRSSGAVAAQGRIRVNENVPSYKASEKGYLATSKLFGDSGILPSKTALSHVTVTPRLKTAQDFESVVGNENLSVPAATMKKRLEEGVTEIYKSGASGIVVKVPTEAIQKIKGSFREGIRKLYIEGVNGINIAAQSNSPSKKAQQAGKNIADGAIKGINEGATQAQKAAYKIGARRVSTDPALGASAIGARVFDPSKDATGLGLLNLEQPVKKTAFNLDSLNQKVMSLSFAMMSINTIASMTGNGLGEFGDVVNQVSMGLFALSGVIELARIVNLKDIGAKLAEKGVTSVGTAIGKLGSGLKSLTAQVIGGTTAIGRLIPVVGLAITAFTVFKLIADAEKKRQQKIDGLAKAANVAGDALNYLAEATGTAVVQTNLPGGFQAPGTTGAATEEAKSIVEQLKENNEEFAKAFDDQLVAIRAASKEASEATLASMALDLQNKGQPPEIIAAVIQMLVDEAGRTDINLDFLEITVDGKFDTAQLKAKANELVDLANSEIKKVTDRSAFSISGGVEIEDTSASTKKLKDEAIALAKAAGAAAGTQLDALDVALANGAISAEEFKTELADVIARLNTIDPRYLNAAIGAAANVFGEDFAEAINTVGSASDKLLLLEAEAANVDFGIGTIEQLNAGGRDAILIREGLKRAIDAQAVAQENLNQKEEVAAQAEIDLKAIQDEIDASEQLLKDLPRIAGARDENGEKILNEKEALDLLTDSKWESLLADAANIDAMNGNTDATDALIAKYAEYLEIKDRVNKAEEYAAASDAMTTQVQNLKEQEAVYDWMIANGTEVARAREILGDATLYAAASEAYYASQAGKAEHENPKEIWELAEAYGSWGDAILYKASADKIANETAASNFDALNAQIDEINRIKAKIFGTAAGGTTTETKDPYAEVVAGLKRAQLETRQQNIAVKKLIQAGLDAADAYALVEDKALAAAIASKNFTTEQLEKLVGLQKELTKELEKQAALEGIRNAIEEFNRASAAESYVKLNYSSLEASAILNDDTLRAMAELGMYGAKEFKERLAQVLSETDFLQSEWDQAFNAVNETFRIEEDALRIQFEIDTAADQDIVKEATRDIELLQDQVDDYNGELRGIAQQESEINEKYQDRYDALDKIQALNSRTAQQERAKLTIADALSRGDIAAAAAAAQQARAERAATVVEDQRSALKLAQEQELANVVSENGRTREQIEKAILELENQIYQIEKERLEPAQRRIEAAQYQLDLEIEALRVEGLSKLEWEAINSQIEVAKTKTTEWIALLQSALAAAQAILAAYKAAASVPPPPKKEDPPPPKKEDSGSGSSEGSSEGSGKDPGKDPGKDNDESWRTKDGTTYTANKAVAEITAAEKESAKGVDAAIVAAKAATNNKNTAVAASTTLAKAAGVVSAAGKLTTSADTASKKIAAVVTKATTTIANNLKAGSLVGKTSPSAGEANRFANLKAAVVPKKTTGGAGGTGYKFMSSGGMVPKYMANGGMFSSLGTDRIPAMLSPGEFVVRKFAVDNFGVDKLKAINSGADSGDSVYNYSVNLNVSSNSNADEIANKVMTQIKRIDSQRIRSNRF